MRYLLRPTYRPPLRKHGSIGCDYRRLGFLLAQEWLWKPWVARPRRCQPSDSSKAMSLLPIMGTRCYTLIGVGDVQVATSPGRL